MEILSSILGKTGIIFGVGIAAFLYVYKYSVGIFDWFENQTIGTRTFILEKCEFLMIEAKQVQDGGMHITDMDGFTNRAQTERVRFSCSGPGLHSSACHPHA